MCCAVLWGMCNLSCATWNLLDYVGLPIVFVKSLGPI